MSSVAPFIQKTKIGCYAQFMTQNGSKRWIFQNFQTHYLGSITLSYRIGGLDLLTMWGGRHLVVKTSTSIYLLQTSVSCSVTTITVPSIGKMGVFRIVYPYRQKLLCCPQNAFQPKNSKIQRWGRTEFDGF